MPLLRILLVMMMVTPLAAIATPAYAGDDGATLARQTLRRQADAAIVTLRTKSAPKLRTVWGTHRVTPQLVTGLRLTTVGKTAKLRATGFLKAHQPWLRAPVATLIVSRTSKSKARTVVAFSQTLEGLPVTGRTLTVTLDAQQRVIQVANDLEQIRRFDRGDLTKDGAVAAAKRALFGPALKRWAQAKATARKVWVVQRGWAVETWEVTVATGLLQQRVVSVAATDGRVFGIRNPILH